MSYEPMVTYGTVKKIGMVYHVVSKRSQNSVNFYKVAHRNPPVA